MKTILLLLIAVTNFVPSVLAGKVDYESLVRVKGRKFRDDVTSQVWWSKQMELRDAKVQVDLMYVYDTTNNPPEIRLVATADGQKFVLWKAVIEDQRRLPVEYSCGLSSKNTVGLCFTCRTGRQILTYEIDVGELVNLMKRGKSQGYVSGWDYPEESDVTNSLCQSIFVRDLLKGGEYIFQTSITNLDSKWVFSGVVQGSRIPKTRVIYQYPVGSTGLTFVKKEEVLPAPPNVKECWQSLGAVRSYIAAWHARQYKMKPGTLVETNSFYKQFPDASKYKCPDGGSYALGEVGGNPKCSVHGVFDLKARPE
jgi:hypothetical protein